ncbi:hypothetical protein F4802DRAFT_590789 [Xylaria palmicola]|nr:hypothetical protein F4802DRAFT_590789 [Xylaria palmicola]
MLGRVGCFVFRGLFILHQASGRGRTRAYRRAQRPGTTALPAQLHLDAALASLGEWEEVLAIPLQGTSGYQATGLSQGKFSFPFLFLPSPLSNPGVGPIVSRQRVAELITEFQRRSVLAHLRFISYGHSSLHHMRYGFGRVTLRNP